MALMRLVSGSWISNRTLCSTVKPSTRSGYTYAHGRVDPTPPHFTPTPVTNTHLGTPARVARYSNFCICLSDVVSVFLIGILFRPRCLFFWRTNFLFKYTHSGADYVDGNEIVPLERILVVEKVMS